MSIKQNPILTINKITPRALHLIFLTLCNLKKYIYLYIVYYIKKNDNLVGENLFIKSQD